jgi:hypothetical protein
MNGSTMSASVSPGPFSPLSSFLFSSSLGSSSLDGPGGPTHPSTGRSRERRATPFARHCGQESAIQAMEGKLAPSTKRRRGHRAAPFADAGPKAAATVPISSLPSMALGPGFPSGTTATCGCLRRSSGSQVPLCDVLAPGPAGWVSGPSRRSPSRCRRTGRLAENLFDHTVLSGKRTALVWTSDPLAPETEPGVDQAHLRRVRYGCARWTAKGYHARCVLEPLGRAGALTPTGGRGRRTWRCC